MPGRSVSKSDTTMKVPRVNFNSADFVMVRKIALTFPGAEESVSHEGTPSVKVRGKLMCRLHESGEFISIRVGFDARDQYLDSHPGIFHLPDHFKPYPYICMWVHHPYDPRLLAEVLEVSWRGLASRKQIAEFTRQEH